MRLKVSSVKQWPFCIGPHVLNLLRTGSQTALRYREPGSKITYQNYEISTSISHSSMAFLDSLELRKSFMDYHGIRQIFTSFMDHSADKKSRKSYGIPALNVPGSYIEFCKNENMPWNYWQAHSQGVPWSLINIMKLCWKLKHINGRHLTSVEFCGVLLSFGDLDIFRIEVSNYKPVLIFWILNKQWIRRRNYFLIIITHGLHRRRRVCCRPLRPSVRPSIPPERRYRSNYLRSSVISLKFGGMMHSSLFCHARPIFAFHVFDQVWGTTI